MVTNRGCKYVCIYQESLGNLCCKNNVNSEGEKLEKKKFCFKRPFP